VITFDAARPFLQKALDLAGNTHSLEDIRREIDAGQLKFFAGINSAIVAGVEQYPQHRVLQFYLAGGNLAELEQIYPLVEAWGREQGCTLASTAGRPGWERTFLKREGWKPRTVLMTKEL
jgi:hypothetical protein